MQDQDPSAPARYSKIGMCGRYGAGHDVFYMAATRTSSRPHITGRLAAVERNLVIVDFGPGDFRAYYNHHPRRLLDTVKVGGTVYVPDPHPTILRSVGGRCFSLLRGEEEWTPCSQERPRRIRFRPPTPGSLKPTGADRAAIGPVLTPVHEAINHWSPLSSPFVREELAFAIVNEVLRVAPVKGQTWSATIVGEPPKIQPTENTLVEQIHITIRSWFPLHPSVMCHKLAEGLVFDVLGAHHVLGELWSVHLPEATAGQGGVDR